MLERSFLAEIDPVATASGSVPHEIAFFGPASHFSKDRPKRYSDAFGPVLCPTGLDKFSFFRV
jgi:hypothetical protein